MLGVLIMRVLLGNWNNFWCVVVCFFLLFFLCIFFVFVILIFIRVFNKVDFFIFDDLIKVIVFFEEMNCFNELIFVCFKLLIMKIGILIVIVFVFIIFCFILLYILFFVKIIIGIVLFLYVNNK